MRKSKISFFYRFLLVFGLIFSTSLLKAQSVNDALRLLDVERFGSATGTMRTLISNNPKDARNYYYAGYIYLNLEKPDSARYYFDQGVSTDPKEPLNYVGQGYLALNAGKPQDAQILFDKAISLSKEKDAVVYNKIADALLHAETKDANKALTYLQKALSLKKSKDEATRIDIDSHLLMGDAYLELKDGGKAITSYERALTLDSKLAKAHVKIGRIYLIPRNFDAALKEFDKAVQADPNYAPVYKDLAELYFNYKKDVAKAKEMLEKYMALSDVKSSRSRYAVFMYLTRDYPAAIIELNKALESDPNNIVLLRLLGYSYFNTQDFPNAKTALDRYFSLVKPDKTIGLDFENYGKTLMKIGQDSLAVINFMKAIEIDTANIDVIQEAAEEFRKAKKFVQACNLYGKLLTIKKNPTAGDYYFKGYSCLYGQQFDEAETALNKFIELQPDKYPGYFLMAQLKNQSDPDGKQGLAKPYYEKVIQYLEVDTVDVAKNRNFLMQSYYYLASYYFLREDMGRAKDVFDKIQKINPNDDKVKAFYEYQKQQKQKRDAQQKGASQKGTN